ncbi:MAG: alpha/beta fold hydrolase, partial [Candidatus Uhrbacteria bacterium]
MKTFITNRKGQRIAVVVEENPEAKGLVFVMHGLGGFKEQPQMQMFAEVFFENGYTTVLFDTTNTLGESEGQYEDGTFGSYYEDLEDVIAWASSQGWYQEPFCMIGHSLGSFCTALYAENFPEKVKGLAPISTVVSGRLIKDSPYFKQNAAEWKNTGWKITESVSKPGVTKRLPWSF